MEKELTTNELIAIRSACIYSIGSKKYKEIMDKESFEELKSAYKKIK